MRDGSPVIYLAIKYHPDNKNKNLIESISSACQSAGFETVCIARDFEKYGSIQFTPRELMVLSFEKIMNAKYLMVDLTEKGVGVGIEAGYAYACGIPVITVLPIESELSETLSGISSYECRYQNPQEIAELLITLDH